MENINQKEIEEKLVKVLANYVDVNDSNFGMETTLDELGLDSFTSIYVLLDLEEAFQIQIPDTKLTPEIFVSPKTLENVLISIINES